jgi:hypothetical protein
MNNNSIRSGTVLCLTLLCLLTSDTSLGDNQKTAKTVTEVLRQPVPPEDLHLSQARGEFIVQGATFAYRVPAKTGVISGIRVVRDGQEVISSSGPAEILIDDYRLPSKANSCVVSNVSKEKGRVVLQASGTLRAPDKKMPEINFLILHTFFSDGVVVSEVKLHPRADVPVKDAIAWRVPVLAEFNSYLHKRRDENGSTAAHGKLPGSGALRFSTLTSCLSVVSPKSALAIFCDSGALHLSRPGLDTAVAEVNSKNDCVLSQYLIHVAPGDKPYLLKAGEEFSFRVGLSVAPNRLEHPRVHDLRMFIWIGDAANPYPSNAEITEVAHWGYTLFQLHRVGTLGEPRPPAGQFERVIKKVHELGMLFIWEENADLMYDSAPEVQKMKASGNWKLWQGFNYDGRYKATMDPYCDLAATCLASPNGLAEYRLANIGRMLDRYPVDGIYLDDNLAYANCTLWKEHHHPHKIYDCLIELHEVNWRRRELMRKRVPHAVLISHNTRAFVLPILADFDIQYFAEGYCFDSVQDYWNNYRAWSLAMNAQGMICPGDDEGVRCGVAIACNYDLLTGGGQYNEMDWRLFPEKFHYAGGVTARELEYCKTYNLAQYYFGLFESKPFYFAESTNLFNTTTPVTYATIYQNKRSKDWLIAVANMDSKAQSTALNFQSPGSLGILENKSYLLFDVHHRIPSSFAGGGIDQVFQKISVPAQNLQLYTLREQSLGIPCHVWGGKRLSETWDKRKQKLMIEIQGPVGLQETVFLSPAAMRIQKVLVGGHSASFCFDTQRSLAHGKVVFTSEPLRIEVFCSAAEGGGLPMGEAQADAIALMSN